MQPSLSVIFFTVVSGCGYGVLFVAAALLVVDPRLLPRSETLALLGIGALFAAAGLLSSTLHLGKPLRAWRAFSQWRSSWLSREGVAAVATFVPVLVAAYAAATGQRALERAAAVVLAPLAGVTVYCTARIYTSLKTIPAWHDALVLPGYLVFALLGGSAWFGATDALLGGGELLLQLDFAVIVAIAGAAAAVLKHGYWGRIDRAAPRTTPESATGLGRFGSVRPLEAPHTEANYLTREMGFVLARRHAARLRVIAVALFAAAPLLAATAVWLAPGIAPVASLAAAAAVTAGSFVERWLFFAEARHVVMTYYRAAPPA